MTPLQLSSGLSIMMLHHGNIVNKFFTSLISKLKEWHIQHIPRSANNVMDFLAKSRIEREIDMLMINHFDG